MHQIKIRGGIPLKGEISISGAKNAALPLMTAALLTDEPLVLTNMPDLADITSMLALLDQHGVSVTPDLPSKVLTLTAKISTTQQHLMILYAKCGPLFWS